MVDFNDTFGYFNPVAFPWNNSVNPSPSALWPGTNPSGIAPTPSGMLGQSFGSPFANIPPNKPPVVTNPMMNPGGGPAPVLPAPTNVGMAPGAANPSVPSAGTPSTSPLNPSSPWNTINDNLAKMTSNPNFAKSAQSLQQILQGSQQNKLQPAQFAPIQMAQPQGGGAAPPAANPWMQALQARVGGMMGTPQAQQSLGMLSPYLGGQ